MSKINISEEMLRHNFIRSHEESSNIKLHLEVPVFCRSVDLVVQNFQDVTISAIEFKIRDWKRAILQVQSVSICFDYLYICIPKPKTQKGYQSVTSACENNGIGLYLFDTTTRTFEKPINSPKTETVWNAQRRRVIGYLEDR